ncbi:MAG: putative polysaccharide biosynthesis protein [Clostridium sp.]
MKKQSLVKGSIILGVAGIITKVLGLFFRWPIIMLIGDEGLGMYQMPFPLYMLFIAIGAGVPVAVSKLVSENNAMGRFRENFVIVKETKIAMMLLGVGYSALMFIFARPIIHAFNWNEEAYYAMVGLAVGPIAISVMTVYRGFFQGMQNMVPTAISQLLEQVGRVVFGVGLAYILLDKGIGYSAGGAALGASLGGFLGGGYLMIKYHAERKKHKIKKVESKPEILSKIFKIAFPVTLGACAGSIMGIIDSAVIPHQLLNAGFNSEEATVLYAQLTGKASVIINLPMTLSMALSISLIPVISEKFILRKYDELNRKVDLSLKISTVISIPCMFGIFIMAEPIMRFLFPGRHEGFEILRYLSLTIPFIILTQTTTAILQGIGKYMLPVINLFIGCGIKLVLTIILVKNPEINVFGSVIASFIAYLFVTIINVIQMKIYMKVKLEVYNNIIKPIIGSLIMGVSVIYSYNSIFEKTTSVAISCLISVFLGIIIYIIWILCARVFDMDDLKRRVPKRK